MENEQRYWPALKNIKIRSRNGNTIEREATVGPPKTFGPFGNAKSLQTLVLDPENKLSTLTMTKGPMLGTRKIVLRSVGEKETRVDVSWEYEMKGVPGFAQGFVKDNISEVTEGALAQIAREAQMGE